MRRVQAFFYNTNCFEFLKLFYSGFKHFLSVCMFCSQIAALAACLAVVRSIDYNLPAYYNPLPYHPTLAPFAFHTPIAFHAPLPYHAPPVAPAYHTSAYHTPAYTPTSHTTKDYYVRNAVQTCLSSSVLIILEVIVWFNLQHQDNYLQSCFNNNI